MTITAGAARPAAADVTPDRAGPDGTEPSAMRADEVARFVYRQGLGKNLLDPPEPVVDDAGTSTCVPPLLARGRTGVPLPIGANPTLAAPFGTVGRPAGPDVLGHLLLAAVGLHRREPSHPYADHRAVASGRAKYPVHVFVLDDRSVRYLDVYRHALVDVAVAVPTELRPVPGTVTVILAGRYQDLPGTYRLARASIVEAELGIATRAITVTAEVHGVRTGVRLGGVAARRAAELVTGTGQGTWSAPVVLTLDGVSVPASRVLPGPAAAAQLPASRAADRLLGEPDPHALAVRRVSATRLADRRLGALGHTTSTGLPPGAPAAGTRPSWSHVLTERSAGRVADRRHGYSLRPYRLSADCLHECLGWAGVVPAEPGLSAIAERVTLRVAIQRTAGYDDGLYRVQDGGAVPEFTDAAIMRLLAARGGQVNSPTTEIGLRHAGLVWLFTADVTAALAEVGPAAWSLMQLYCGWVMHGLGIVAAANGLISRPSRSYDEPTLQHTLRLSRGDVPMFMTICGRSAFDEPMLDLRP